MPPEPDLVIVCSVCEKKLRVPASSSGKRFRCPGCKTVLSHPGTGPEQAEAPDETGSEGKKKKKRTEDREKGRKSGSEEDRPPRKKEKPARKKAGRDRGAARPHSRSKAQADRPSRRAGGERRGRGRLLLLGAAALLLAGAAAAAAFLFLPSEPAPPPEEPPEASEPVEEPPAEVDDTGDRAPETGELSPEDEAFLRKALTALTPREYKAAGDEARARGLDGAARELWRWAVEKNFPDAFEGALPQEEVEGLYENIGYLYYEIPEEARSMAEEEGILEDLEPYHERWLPPSLYERVKEREPESLAAAREEFRKRRDDPIYAKAQVIKAKLRDAKGFKDYIFGHRYDEPYLVLDERGRKGEQLADVDEIDFLIEKKIGMLRQVFRFVKSTWMDPLGIEQKNTEPMVAVQFANYGSFIAYNRAIGLNIPPGAMAYFSRINTFIFMFDRPADTPEERDRQDGILFHEATHQIVSAFLNEPGRSMMGAVRVSHWFNEGIAEYVGSCTRSEDDEGRRIWIFGQLNPGRVEEFYHALHPGKFRGLRSLGLEKPYALTLREMAECIHPMHVMQKVMPKFGRLQGRHMIRYQSIASSLIYAQASFFLYFCHRGPKKDDYGPRLMRYAAEEFKGKGGWDALCKAFEGVDMARLEHEWIEFLEKNTTDRTKQGS